MKEKSSRGTISLIFHFQFSILHYALPHTLPPSATAKIRILPQDTRIMRRIKFLLLCALLALPSLAWADDPTVILDNSVCDFKYGYIHFDCIPLFIAHVVKYLFAGVGTFALLQIIYGGYQIALGGAMNTREAGINRIRLALIGLAVTLLIFAIINFVIFGFTAAP